MCIVAPIVNYLGAITIYRYVSDFKPPIVAREGGMQSVAGG
jgi:hypothetical protein